MICLLNCLASSVWLNWAELQFMDWNIVAGGYFKAHQVFFLQPTYSLGQYTGHSANVTSLDFHPKKTEIFCSCDANGEIRYWNINQSACSRVSKVDIWIIFCIFFWLLIFLPTNFVCLMWAGCYRASAISAKNWTSTCSSSWESGLHLWCGNWQANPCITGIFILLNVNNLSWGW